MHEKHVKKSELLQFLKEKYQFFDDLCKKYNLNDDIFYKEKLSEEEIRELHSFLSELLEHTFGVFSGRTLK